MKKCTGSSDVKHWAACQAHILLTKLTTLDKIYSKPIYFVSHLFSRESEIAKINLHKNNCEDILCSVLA